MQRSSLARTLIPLLLLGSLLLPQARSVVSADPPSSTEAWYDMDREAWLHTDDERLVRTKYDLRNGPNLDELPLQLGPWTGRDVPIANEATFPTLDADRIVYRMYQRSGLRTLIFSVVGATKGQSLHHPLICYQFAGWPVEDRGTTTVPIGDGEVVLRYVIGKDPRGPAQVDLHFFLWPTTARGWEDGVTQVRITALVTVTEEIALADARAFATLLFAQARRLDELALTPTPRPTPAATLEPTDLGAPAPIERQEAAAPGLPRQLRVPPPAELPAEVPLPPLTTPTAEWAAALREPQGLGPASLGEALAAAPRPPPAAPDEHAAFPLTPLPRPRPPVLAPPRR